MQKHLNPPLLIVMNLFQWKKHENKIYVDGSVKFYAESMFWRVTSKGGEWMGVRAMSLVPCNLRNTHTKLPSSWNLQPPSPVFFLPRQWILIMTLISMNFPIYFYRLFTGFSISAFGFGAPFSQKCTIFQSVHNIQICETI